MGPCCRNNILCILPFANGCQKHAGRKHREFCLWCVPKLSLFTHTCTVENWATKYNQVGSIQDCTVGRPTFFQIRMPRGNLTNKLHALFWIDGNIVTDVRTKHRWLFHRNTGKKSHLVGFHDFVGEPTISFAVLVTAPRVRVVRVGHWRTTQNTPSSWTELGRWNQAVEKKPVDWSILDVCISWGIPTNGGLMFFNGLYVGGSFPQTAALYSAQPPQIVTRTKHVYSRATSAVPQAISVLGRSKWAGLVRRCRLAAGCVRPPAARLWSFMGMCCRA